MPVRADRDAPLKWFFEAVPRPEFDEALLVSGDPRFYRLYDSFHDDVYRHTSPGTLCRRFGISLQDLHELWRSYTLSLARMAMADLLPEIMNQVAEDSLSSEEPCPRCDGVGLVAGDAQCGCPMCQGVGRVRVPGDPQARRLLFEIVHRLKPGVCND